jgi:dihydroxy-acid dehydratase
MQALTMALGGSTNAVLHLIAIAHSVGITLTIDDFQSVSDRVPFLADLKPSGKYVMEDVNTIGGIPSKPKGVHAHPGVINYLIKLGIMTGDEMTVTGKTLGENVDRWVEKHGSKWEGQKVMRPIDNPIKDSGHIR